MDAISALVVLAAVVVSLALEAADVVPTSFVDPRLLVDVVELLEVDVPLLIVSSSIVDVASSLLLDDFGWVTRRVLLEPVVDLLDDVDELLIAVAFSTRMLLIVVDKEGTSTISWHIMCYNTIA